jgi:hypothetical protein
VCRAPRKAIAGAIVGPPTRPLAGRPAELGRAKPAQIGTKRGRPGPVSLVRSNSPKTESVRIKVFVANDLERKNVRSGHFRANGGGMRLGPDSARKCDSSSPRGRRARPAGFPPPMAALRRVRFIGLAAGWDVVTGSIRAPGRIRQLGRGRSIAKKPPISAKSVKFPGFGDEQYGETRWTDEGGLHRRH